MKSKPILPDSSPRPNFGTKGPLQGYEDRSDAEYSCVDSEGNPVFTPVPSPPASPQPSVSDPIEIEPATNPETEPSIEPTTTKSKEDSDLSIEPANSASPSAGIEPAPSLAQLGLQYRVAGKPADSQRTLKPIDDITSRRLERVATDRITKPQFRRRARAKYCTLCRRNINGNQFVQHLQGQEHKKAVQKEEEKKLDLSCKICSTEYRSLHDLQRHNKSKAHHRALIRERNKKEGERLSPRSTPIIYL